jgi:hypothetical protein
MCGETKTYRAGGTLDAADPVEEVSVSFWECGLYIHQNNVRWSHVQVDSRYQGLQSSIRMGLGLAFPFDAQ